MVLVVAWSVSVLMADNTQLQHRNRQQKRRATSQVLCAVEEVLHWMISNNELQCCLDCRNQNYRHCRSQREGETELAEMHPHQSRRMDNGFHMVLSLGKNNASCIYRKDRKKENLTAKQWAIESPVMLREQPLPLLVWNLKVLSWISAVSQVGMQTVMKYQQWQKEPEVCCSSQIELVLKAAQIL